MRDCNVVPYSRILLR